MSKALMVLIAVSVCGVIVVGICGLYFVSVKNTEVGLRNAITAKMKDNESEFDNMFKKIAQTAQVTDAQKNALKEIFIEHAQARSAGSKGGSLATWVQESVPNVDTTTFNNLQNIISGSRDRWTMRQKELIDLSREHQNLLMRFPSSIVCSAFGAQPITITVITSTHAKEAMQTGTDDNIDVFQKK